MNEGKKRNLRRKCLFAAAFLLVNVLSIAALGVRESAVINRSLSQHTRDTQERFDGIMENYERSFRLFVQMMRREIAHSPDPDEIWDYLKALDDPLLEIEGDTFDGLYMYYQGRYLYSWSTPYSVYEDSGYVATERPWYKTAAQGKGEVVFTPPYMSYANHYILTTISQLQPDGVTVFAYDIKMGDIQSLVTSANQFRGEQMMIFDSNGTIIGSTEPNFLGGNLYATLDEAAKQSDEAQAELAAMDPDGGDEYAKAEDKAGSAAAFCTFRQDFDGEFAKLYGRGGEAIPVTVSGTKCFGYLRQAGGYSFMTLVPVSSILLSTAVNWLVPFLLMEMVLLYLLARVSKEQRNRELKAAYVELGQTQKRLELALAAAQKAAAIDDLTGMMNFKSFRKEMSQLMDAMDDDERGILIMIDGDHFKQVNDNYGHSIGDEVIKLSAQMIIGRIRTVDLASRLHGDEFAIFVSDTADYAVAKRIMDDINRSIAKEAARRKVPSITLSSGAVVARRGDSYNVLSKLADAALYQAKETHNGGFAGCEVE